MIEAVWSRPGGGFRASWWHPRQARHRGILARQALGQLLDPGQITDAYLLALAVQHRGMLATLDTRLNPRSVRHGPEALESLQERHQGRGSAPT